MAASAGRDVGRTFPIMAASSSYTTPRELGLPGQSAKRVFALGLASRRDSELYRPPRLSVKKARPAAVSDQAGRDGPALSGPRRPDPVGQEAMRQSVKRRERWGL